MWDPLSQYRHDYPEKKLPHTKINEEGYKLRQSHFKFGDDINNYMTTSMLQNKSVQENPKIPSVLDQAAKNDLRKSHFNLGNNPPNFETTFNSEFYDKSKSLPKEDKNFGTMGKMLRSHNYEFGDDKPDYISEHKYRFSKPVINPEERLQNKISNQLLQKSNHNFGNNKDPWNSTNEYVFTPKYIPQEEKKNINLVKTNFILGDTKPDYNTINNQTYKSYPCQFVPLNKDLLVDLQRHHYKLGNVNDPLMSQNQVDFKDPSLFGNNFNPTMDNNSLRRTNWKLGDALPSEIYNTTYNTVHTPKKSEILPANVLRSSGINLVSNNTPLDYLTDYRDNFNEKKRDLDSQKEMKNLMKQIRRSHFSFGESKNDYNTSSRAAYRFDPEEAKKAQNKLNTELIKDLRRTHYRLGYSDDVGISTQKKDFIPYGIINEGRKDRMVEGNINFGAKEEFKGISIYQSDYTKKDLQDNGNDCYC